MTDNALIIIRELTRTQSSFSFAQIFEVDDLNESLMSYERKILADTMPPNDDDERLNRVLQEAVKHLQNE